MSKERPHTHRMARLAGVVVELIYYAPSGTCMDKQKYISRYDREHNIEKIHDEVQAMVDGKTLPGLVEDHSHYLVTVDVPTHPQNYSRLCLPKIAKISLQEDEPKPLMSGKASSAVLDIGALARNGVKS